MEVEKVGEALPGLLERHDCRSHVRKHIGNRSKACGDSGTLLVAESDESFLHIFSEVYDTMIFSRFR
jgi:hypothetical protein